MFNTMPERIPAHFERQLRDILGDLQGRVEERWGFWIGFDIAPGSVDYEGRDMVPVKLQFLAYMQEDHGGTWSNASTEAGSHPASSSQEGAAGIHEDRSEDARENLKRARDESEEEEDAGQNAAKKPRE